MYILLFELKMFQKGNLWFWLASMKSATLQLNKCQQASPYFEGIIRIESSIR